MRHEGMRRVSAMDACVMRSESARATATCCLGNVVKVMPGISASGTVSSGGLVRAGQVQKVRLVQSCCYNVDLLHKAGNTQVTVIVVALQPNALSAHDADYEFTTTQSTTECAKPGETRCEIDPREFSRSGKHAGVATDELSTVAGVYATRRA